MRAAERALPDTLSAISSAMQRHRAALLFALLLHVADTFSTHLGLQLGVPEGNLLPATVMAQSGEMAMHSLKLVTVTLVILSICVLDARYPRLWRVVYITNALMVAVVFSNALYVLGR